MDVMVPPNPLIWLGNEGGKCPNPSIAFLSDPSNIVWVVGMSQISFMFLLIIPNNVQINVSCIT